MKKKNKKKKKIIKVGILFTTKTAKFSSYGELELSGRQHHLNFHNTSQGPDGLLQLFNDILQLPPSLLPLQTKMSFSFRTKRWLD